MTQHYRQERYVLNDVKGFFFVTWVEGAEIA